MFVAIIYMAYMVPDVYPPWHAINGHSLMAGIMNFWFFHPVPFP